MSFWSPNYSTPTILVGIHADTLFPTLTIGEPSRSGILCMQYFYCGQTQKATVRPDFKLSLLLFKYFHFGKKPNS